MAARLKYRACAAAHFEEGVRLCREALALGLKPERAALAQLVLARHLAAVARWEDAAAAYSQALRLQPDDPSTARRLGLLLWNALGRAADAEVYLRQALSAAPADSAARVALALALQALGRADEAQGEFRAALNVDPALFENRPAAQAAFEALRAGQAWP